MEGLNVLSLFDGMSCGQIALERAGFKVNNYYASEIEEEAIKVTMSNYPSTIQLGDVNKVKIKTLFLSEVYEYICLKYFDNDLPYLQSIIAEWEMLYRINEKQTLAAYFGTQKPNESKEISTNTILSINDSIWFFKCEMGNVKGIYDIIRSGERRKGTNTIDVSELCKHSFWWNGDRQSECRVAEKGICWTDGESAIRKNKAKTKRGGNKAIFDYSVQAGGISENKNTNERPNNETKLSIRYERNRQKGFREEEIRYREEEKHITLSKTNGNIRSKYDYDAITQIDKNILCVYKNPQVTLVKCEWGIIVSLECFSLLQAGSPCQDISNLSKFKLGLDGTKSSLFYQYWRMWQETKPKYFLLENVAGNKSAIASITKLMGVRPIKISSNWVTAQNRMRYYWTNIPVNTLPQKKKLYLKDILENNVNEKYYQNEGWLKWWEKNSGFQLEKGYSTLNADKAACLTKRMYACWNGNFIQDEKGIRRLTPIECERLQTVPDNYTQCVDDKFRYELLGNGWTVDIISHILKHMK